MRTRVKICGITRPEDALAAVAAGADAIGLVFYAPSPRAVTAEQAAAIAEQVAPFVTLTGLFVDAPETEVRAVLESVPLELLQFHGQETPVYCAQFKRRYIKAVSMQTAEDLPRAATRYADACGLLLDTYHPAQPGGTGECFNWEWVPPDYERPLILAGGLTPDNVGAAVTQVRPYAVDVSSGVEQAKGIKDAAKMNAFIQEVRRV